MEKQFNGCINLLSSRNQCLPKCLKSLWDHWNYRYNYPIYVHYFDDIYDSQEYRENIWNTINENIHFRSIPYKTPGFLKEEELFYNRRNIWYVRNSFPRTRKGYLHMSHYFNNFYGYNNTEFEKYDYVMSIDDESLFLKEVPYNFFEIMSNKTKMAGAIKVTYPHLKPPKQGNYDTRVGMWKHVSDYIKKYNIEPQSDFILNLLNDPDAERKFHQQFIFADSYVFKTELFRTPVWNQWNKALNESGGIYKYRWGDHELNSLFFSIHYGYVVHDFKTVDEGYHDQGGLRYIQGYAPGVKDLKK
jgi:hypothetical protein